MTERRTVALARPATGLDEWEAVREPLVEGWLTQGPRVQAFEDAFAQRHKVGQAVATTSGTTALHLALCALGVGPGDEVIVPAFTWIATANAVVYCGARPIFVDVDTETYNLDPRGLAAVLTLRTKAVVAVHLFGLCADVEAIRDAAGGAAIVEDAACAAGSEYRGRPVGGLGRAAAFSFHPRKAITTGEGGMVTTDDGALAERLRVLRNHGASPSEEEQRSGPAPHLLPDFDVLGFNHRMTEVQAAIGLVQLGKMDGFIAERRRWAAYYERELSPIPWLRTPRVPDGYGHCWQSYVLYVEEHAPQGRDEIMRLLQARGIATRPGTHAVHTLGYYRQTLGTRPEDCPRARDCQARTLAIPMHNRMEPADYEYVVDSLRALA